MNNNFDKESIMTKKILTTEQIIKIMIEYIKNQNKNISIVLTDKQIAQFAEKLVQVCNNYVGENYMSFASTFGSLKKDMEGFVWAHDTCCQFVFYKDTSFIKEDAAGLESLRNIDCLSNDEINVLYKNNKLFQNILGFENANQNELSM